MTNLYQFRFMAMGGQNELRLYSSSEEAAGKIANKAINEVFRIEQRYSRYLPGSLISQINNSSGMEFALPDAESIHLFQVADHWFNTSDGMFDITSGILRNLWNSSLKMLPSQDEIKQFLENVGWHKVIFGDGKIQLPKKGMELDLGGVAKEYAVDRATQVLMEEGVISGLVNLGGDIRILGPHLDGSPWPIQIVNPTKSGGILATINVAKGSLTTSGDYLRYLEIDGKKYCHILNPKTGLPVSYWKSVTVLAPLCLQAGYTSTFSMLLEAEALDMLNKSSLQYLLVGPNEETIHNLGQYNSDVFQI
jgi:FAD:protein FMN transferase